MATFPEYNMSKQFPTASVSAKPSVKISAAWIVPILAALVAIILLAQWLQARGPLVTITFEDARGLTTDAPIMFRGAIVGRVENVQLNTDASRIVVRARLNATAQDLAREGTRWWIVHPEISLEGISGLDTLISPRYLTLSVGTGTPKLSFDGVDSLMMTNEQLNGVKFTLITDSITGITVSTPLYYRGVVVGSVSNILFAPNAVAVLIDVVVKHEYANLVRTNTKFWSISGIDLDVGFTGISLNIGPFTSLLKGGIQLATPNQLGEVAPAGHGFTLEKEMDEDWLEWTPILPLERDINVK